MNTAIDLIKFIGKPEFVLEMVKLPVWEKVRPNTYRHKISSCANGRYGGCLKCVKEWKTPEEYESVISSKCIPDPFAGSLGDLAFELWGKVKSNDYYIFAVNKVMDLVWGTEGGFIKWTKEATAEMIICAALLALEEMEK